MATQRKEDTARPDVLRMDGTTEPEPEPATKDYEHWTGWPTKKLKPRTLEDEQGRVKNVRAPVMDLEGLITPTDLYYVVQHFDVPQPVRAADWTLTVHGEVKRTLKLDYEELRRFPGRTVRTVMECSGSDAAFFEYFKGEGPRPSRTKEGMILSASEWTGTPLAGVLNEAGLAGRAVAIRAEGWDKGVPSNADPEMEPFYYDKGLPLEKAIHPDTILAWAQNGQLLEHIHGAPVRLLVPGWSGNWSVKWLSQLEVMDHVPDCWYHYNFYYYGDSPEDPERELITTVGVKSIVTYPGDGDDETLARGPHVVRGYAWSGAGAIAQVEVSVDGGETWLPARVEEPRDRFMWVRWSYLWDAPHPGRYSIMSMATDEVGRIQSREPRYNCMRKNFSAIVGNDVTIR